MSYYTLFKGWLLLSLPLGFIALLVRKRAPFFDSVTFPLVLKYVGSKDWDTQKGARAKLSRRESGLLSNINHSMESTSLNSSKNNERGRI